MWEVQIVAVLVMGMTTTASAESSLQVADAGEDLSGYVGEVITHQEGDK